MKHDLLFVNYRLELARDRSQDTSQFVVTRYRDANSNLRTQFLRIIKRAGLPKWPKLFQNCRASRETELLDAGFPPHVVAAWIGHSVKVQNANYAQVADHHFEQATSTDSSGVVRQVVQYDSESGGTGETTNAKDREQPKVFRGLSSEFTSVRSKRIAVEGLEPVNKNTGADMMAGDGGTPGGTLADDSNRYVTFYNLLTDRGFTEKHLRQIHSAMQSAGVTLTMAERVTDA